MVSLVFIASLLMEPVTCQSHDHRDTMPWTKHHERKASELLSEINQSLDPLFERLEIDNNNYHLKQDKYQSVNIGDDISPTELNE